jgi:superfamily I DNA and/or RNA helicase
LPPITDVDTRQFQPEGDWLAEDRMDQPPSTALVAMSDDWMERSLFEWLYLRRQGIPRVMLDRQFRMHPHIGEFISQVFYEGKLLNGVSAEARHLTFGDFQSAVCVVSTSQYRDRHERAGSGANGTSYCNPTEAEIVTRILRQAASGLSQPASFGIITPYAAQKKLLQDRVAAIVPELANVDLDPEEDIGSVDSYQGSERDCIIVSMVRSPADCPRCRGRGTTDRGRCNECRGRGFHGAGLTFARDLRRLNVAFSRARCSLIVVGDFARLCDPNIRGGEEGGRILQQFAEHVLKRGGTVQHVWEGGSNEF